MWDNSHGGPECDTLVSAVSLMAPDLCKRMINKLLKHLKTWETTKTCRIDRGFDMCHLLFILYYRVKEK